MSPKMVVWGFITVSLSLYINVLADTEIRNFHFPISAPPFNVTQDIKLITQVPSLSRFVSHVNMHQSG